MRRKDKSSGQKGAVGMQLIVLLVTWQLPDWLGENLSKAGLIYVSFALILGVQG